MKQLTKPRHVGNHVEDSMIGFVTSLVPQCGYYELSSVISLISAQYLLIVIFLLIMTCWLTRSHQGIQFSGLWIRIQLIQFYLHKKVYGIICSFTYLPTKVTRKATKTLLSISVGMMLIQNK